MTSLYEILSVHLLQAASKHLKSRDGDFLHHEFISAGEYVTELLWRLDLARPLSDPDLIAEKSLLGFQIDCNWVITAKPEEVPARLQEPLAVAPQLSELLRGFEHIEAQYGRFPIRRAPFTPPETYERVTQALLSGEYLYPVGTQYAWAYKITPEMRDLWVWDPETRCYGRKYKLREFEEAMLAYLSMRSTPGIASNIIMETDKRTAVRRAINLKWKDWQWRGQSDIMEHRDNSETIADYLYQLMFETEAPGYLRNSTPFD